MRARASRAYERHLLVCEPCWLEVALGRAGREVAEQGREVAPPELRERLRTVVASSGTELSENQVRPFASGAPQHRSPGRYGTDGRPHRRRRAIAGAVRPVSAVAVVAAIALLVTGGAVLLRAPQPGPLDAAVADYRAARLPGDLLPAAAAPDLAPAGLTTVGAASGVVDGRSVTAYAYRDASGSRLLVYRSDEPFPTADDARLLAGPDGPWVADEDGVTVLCASDPHALLVLGDREQLVLTAAQLLEIV